MLMSTTPAARQGPEPLAATGGGLLGKLGSRSYQHRRLVAITWIGALAVISLAGRLAGPAFRYDLNGGTATPSQQAASFLQRHFPGQAGDVSQVVLASVHSPFAPGAAVQVSADRHIAYGLVRFDASGDALPDTAIQRLIGTAQRAERPGFAVQHGGTPMQKVEKPQFGKSEAVGILAAVLILLLAFGSLTPEPTCR
jgi:hypothetical protein